MFDCGAEGGLNRMRRKNFISRKTLSVHSAVNGYQTQFRLVQRRFTKVAEVCALTVNPEQLT